MLYTYNHSVYRFFRAVCSFQHASEWHKVGETGPRKSHSRQTACRKWFISLLARIIDGLSKIFIISGKIFVAI